MMTSQNNAGELWGQSPELTSLQGSGFLTALCSYKVGEDAVVLTPGLIEHFQGCVVCYWGALRQQRKLVGEMGLQQATPVNIPLVLGNIGVTRNAKGGVQRPILAMTCLYQRFQLP